MNRHRPKRIIACLLLAAVGATVSVSVTSCGPARRAEPLVGPVRLATDQERRGEQVYAVHCYQCHPHGEAGLGPAINDKPLPAGLIKTQIRTGLGKMPAFSEKSISDADVDAVIAYAKALRRNEPGPHN